MLSELSQEEVGRQHICGTHASAVNTIEYGADGADGADAMEHDANVFEALDCT